MKYDVDYFLKKFDAIPESEWITKYYHSDLVSPKYCVLGHCGMRHPSTTLTPEAQHLVSLFMQTLEVHPAKVNDGIRTGIALQHCDNDHCYKDLGDTPKERIMNTLILIKAGVRY